MLDRATIQRFWAKVDRSGPDDCWLWKASTDGRYGEFWLSGGKQKAHRVAWSIANGKPFPPDMLACHTCDRPACVNPSHIFVGTMSDNILDAVAKGRWVNPISHGTKRRLKRACVHGHEYTPENTYVDKRGRRNCRICKRTHLRASRAAQRTRIDAHLEGEA